MSRPSAPCVVLALAGLAAAVLLESLTMSLLIVAVLVCVLLTPRSTGAPLPASDDVPEPAEEHDRVLIVSASIGAGHDGAAAELAREATASGYLVDRVDFIDLLPLRLGPLMRSAYHWQIRRAPATWGWVLARLQHPSGASWASALPGRLARRRLLDACVPSTRLVISTYPLASQALSQLRLNGSLDIPAVTYLTDMSVHPLWVAPGIDHHLALHEVPARAARALGALDVAVVGPRVSPRFGPTSDPERSRARSRLGLPLDARIALVVAGSWGVGDVAKTARDLVAEGAAIPAVVCGSNTKLRRSLQGLPGVYSFGWIDTMPELMSVCDLVVQNAGGLTSLEALASGLPVITYRTLPGHGQMNAAALEVAGWVNWARSKEDLRALVATASPALAPVSSSLPWTHLSGHPVLSRA